MLVLPTSGIIQSIHKIHQNLKFNVLSDWIEGSILFSDTELSIVDIADRLISEQRFSNEDLAKEAISTAFVLLRRRVSSVGENNLFLLERNKIIRRNHPWEENPTQAFLTLLSLATRYDWWVGEFGRDYTEQGELFELITKLSIETQFERFTVFQTGWTRSNTEGLEAIVDEISTRLGEKKGNYDIAQRPNAKELGLDLLWYWNFPDERVAAPVHLVQCASGGNWKEKRKSPDLATWNKIIDFTIPPMRAFSSPFDLEDFEFWESCVVIEGVFIERNRILNAFLTNPDWVPVEISQRMLNWLNPRVNILLGRST